MAFLFRQIVYFITQLGVLIAIGFLALPILVMINFFLYLIGFEETLWFNIYLEALIGILSIIGLYWILRKPVRTIIDKYLDQLFAYLGILVGITIALYALAIPLDLLLRLMRVGNIFWLNEVIEYSLYIGVFLAAPWVLRQGAHVRVDILLTSLTKGAAQRLEILLNLIGLTISLAMTYLGFLAVKSTYISESTSMKMLEVYEYQLLFPVFLSGAMLSIEFVLRSFRTISTETQTTTEEAIEVGF